MQGGFITGLLQPSNSAIPQTIPASSLQGRTARNDLSSVRSKYGTESFCVFNQLDSANSSRKRCEDHSVPRRLSSSAPGTEYFVHSCKHAVGNSRIPRVPGKLREVCPCTAKVHHLPRNSVGPLAKSKVPTTRKSCSCGQKSHTDFRNRQGIAKRASKSNRLTEFCQFCNSSRKAESSGLPQISKFFAQTYDQNKTQPPLSGARGDAVVATELLSCYKNTHASTNTFSGHRCFRHCVGGSNKQRHNVGHLETRGKTSTFQSERIAIHLQNSRDSCDGTGTRVCIDSVRQPDCSSVSSQRRRDKIPSTYGPGSEDFSDSRRASDSSQNPSYTRQVQQPRGLSIQATAVAGMAFTSELHGDDLCEDGSTSDRLVRLQNSSSGGQLCNSGSSRPRGYVSRCVQPDMELSSRLDISTSISHPQSADAPQSGHRSVSNCSPALGEGVLESRSQISGDCSPVYPEEPETVSDRHDNRAATTTNSGHDSRNLEMCGWAEKIKSWNPSQVDLLKSSWRASTWKTYKVAWNRWKTWAHRHNVNPTNPEGSELAQFLADLFLKDNLSYNTILLHKSVISTLCNAELSGKLSENVLVKHILKSISLKKPKASKPPIWDINVFTTYLGNYSVSDKNVFQTVRHTAALLVLCSGRRIHDLTLLSVDKDHCILQDDFVIFWPQFGSKTDCSEYRQSGWKLLPNPQNQNLNPLYWVQKTIEVLKERRCKSGSSSLFVTLRGSPSPASRTVIAGWIKSLMAQAGITATPGSVRSAVASSNWINSFPLDDILARGNWKSVKTFQNFYRREVLISAGNHSTITNLFNPVQ